MVDGRWLFWGRAFEESGQEIGAMHEEDSPVDGDVMHGEGVVSLKEVGV